MCARVKKIARACACARIKARAENRQINAKKNAAALFSCFVRIMSHYVKYICFAVSPCVSCYVIHTNIDFRFIAVFSFIQPFYVVYGIFTV